MNVKDITRSGRSQRAANNYMQYNPVIENSRVSKSGCLSVGWLEGQLTEEEHEGNF